METEVTQQVFVTILSLARTLRRLSLKIVTVKAMERNELLCSAFRIYLASIVPDPNMLMFANESAKDQRTHACKRGRLRIGRRCYVRRIFVRGQQYSVLPILTLDGIIAYRIFKGSVTSEK